MAPKAIRANEEFFDLLAGDIFARLYTSFPEPIEIRSSSILFNDDLGKSDGFDDDLGRLERLSRHTIQWLRDEGYLRFGQVATQDDESEVFFDAVLTSKGLEALRKTPATLAGPGVTLGDQIEATAKDISSEAAKAMMKQLIPLALGWIKGVSGL